MKIRNAFAKLPWWGRISILGGASLLFVRLCAWIGVKILVPTIGWDVGVMELAGSAGLFERWLARWDSMHYLNIAGQGYRPGGMERAFYPLYPLLARGITWLTHLPLLWSGLLLSSLCFLGACLLLYRWVLLDHDPETANWSVFWLCVFPMAFFFEAFYPEGLFLLLCLTSFYLARRGRFILGGLAILLAGATRPLAFLLAVPYLVEFLQQHDFRLRRLVGIALGSLLAPLGTLAFMGFLSRQAGDHRLLAVPLGVLAGDYQRSFSWPGRALYDGLRGALFGKGIPPAWFSRAVNIQDAFHALLGFTAAVWSLFRLRLSAALYILATVLFLITTHGPSIEPLQSFPRHLAALFPIYPVLALWTQRLPVRLRWMPVAVSVLLLGFLTAWFATGRWVA